MLHVSLPVFFYSTASEAISCSYMLTAWFHVRMFFSNSNPLFDFGRLQGGVSLSQSCLVQLLRFHSWPGFLVLSYLRPAAAPWKRSTAGWLKRGIFPGVEILEAYTRRDEGVGVRQGSLDWLPVLTTVMQRPHSWKMFQNSWDIGDRLRVYGAFNGSAVNSSVGAQATFN